VHTVRSLDPKRIDRLDRTITLAVVQIFGEKRSRPETLGRRNNGAVPVRNTVTNGV